MEQAVAWSQLDEIDGDGPIDELAAQRVRENASAGCLLCVLEETDTAWEDE